MKRTNKRPDTTSAWLLGICLSLVSPLTLAMDVETLGLFELDGDAVESETNDNPPVDIPGFDWKTLYDNLPPGETMGGTPGVVYTFKSDPEEPAHQIFAGGVKDIQDISLPNGITNKVWKWTTGSVPDKSNLKNAYAASMIDPVSSDRIIFFGADRFSNVGDTFMGFWFFKEKVEIPEGSTGDFSGVHTSAKYDGSGNKIDNGDALVLVSFPQANNAVPLIQVVEWDATCDGKGANKIVKNNFAPDDCIANNLRLVAGEEGTGAICDVPPILGGGNPNACAITNDTTVDAPWPYTSKDGLIKFPFETFFEGGINLTQLLPGDTCFASFMAETRSSSSFTADLKDFVLADFPVCSTDIATEIHSNDLADPGPEDHETDYQVTFDNDGNPISLGIPAGRGVHDLAKITFGAPAGVNVLGTVTFTTYAKACSELLDENGDPKLPLLGDLNTYSVDIDFTTSITNGGDLLVESNGWANDSANSGVDRDDTDFPNPSVFAYLVQFTSSTDGIPDSDYHCEQLTVNKLTPDVVTRIHEGSRAVSNHPDTDIQTTFNEDGSIKVEGIVEVGTIIHDLGEVKGKNGLLPDGTITFEFYDDDKCGVNGGSLLNGDENGNPTDMKELSEPASGVIAIAESSDFNTTGYFSVTDGDTKGFSILARYSGDNNYSSVTAGCEILTVSKRTPGIETHVILLDQAKVTGDGNTITDVGDPTGKVKFNVFKGGNCTTGVEIDDSPFTVDIPATQTAGEWIAKLAQEFIVRTSDGSALDTSVSFLATYLGDNNYKSVEHGCEVVDVSLPARSPTPVD